jgi:hypothetical protein
VGGDEAAKGKKNGAQAECECSQTLETSVKKRSKSQHLTNSPTTETEEPAAPVWNDRECLLDRKGN